MKRKEWLVGRRYRGNIAPVFISTYQQQGGQILEEDLWLEELLYLETGIDE